MPERSGLVYAPLDPNFLADAKFRKLARLLPEPADFLAAVGTWAVALAGAYRRGKPDVNVGEEPGSERYVPALIECGLLVDNGIPPDSFEKWRPKPRPRYPSDERVPAPRTPPDSPEPVRSEPELPTPSDSAFARTELNVTELNRTEQNRTEKEESAPRAREGRKLLRIDPGAKLEDGWVDISQKLEELTGKPYGVQPYSKPGELLRGDLRDHGAGTVLEALSRVYTLNGRVNDPGRLAFAAHDLLNPPLNVRELQKQEEKARQEERDAVAESRRARLREIHNRYLTGQITEAQMREESAAVKAGIEKVGAVLARVAPDVPA